MSVMVGDWVMSGPAVGRESTFHKAIQLMGSVHTHDEKVGVLAGQPVVGNAHVPYFELEPLAERIREAESGERVMAIFRWAEFMKGQNKTECQKYRFVVNGCLQLTAMRKTPYDKKAIRSHARNYLRARLRPYFPRIVRHWLAPILKHSEHKIFCTEGCVEVDEAADAQLRNVHLNVRDKMGRQQLVAPVHAERLVRDGHLVCIADFGLMDRLAAAWTHDRAVAGAFVRL